MTAQRGFWDDPDLTPQERFERFNSNHPEVYGQLKTLCRRWRRGSERPWSIKGAFEVLRWERQIAGLPAEDEDWKLNNNYHSRYARLLMEQESDLDGIFELRELRS